MSDPIINSSVVSIVGNYYTKKLCKDYVPFNCSTHGASIENAKSGSGNRYRQSVCGNDWGCCTTLGGLNVPRELAGWEHKNPNDKARIYGDLLFVQTCNRNL